MSQTGACYIRVSTEDQTEYSPDAQLRLLTDYAKKNDISLSEEHIYIDAGISGRKADKRPAFMKMISAAKTKPRPFEIILVHKFDRFARSREDSVVYKSLLKKEAGIKVISITESIDDDKFSVILEAMLEAMAEYYSLNLSEEVKKGMTEKARRGELQTPAPFGYRMVNGLLIPHKDESEIVRRIFHKYVNEKASMRAIAKYINSLGFKTKMGNTFDTRLVEYIIYNPTYIGKMRWTPTGSVISKHDYDNPDTMILDAKHEAIVDAKIWEEANKIIRRKKKNKMPHYDPKEAITTHWLRGILRCASCGSALSFGKRGGNRQSAFRCNKYLTGGCKESQWITVNRVENIVLNTLIEDSKYFSQGYFEKAPTPDNSKDDEIENYNKRVNKLNSQLEKARELVLSGIDTPEEYRINKNRINEQIEILIEKIRDLQDSADKNTVTPQKKIKNIVDILLSDVSYTEKNIAIKEIINKIVYNKKNNSFEFYYYFIN